MDPPVAAPGCCTTRTPPIGASTPWRRTPAADRGHRRGRPPSSPGGRFGGRRRNPKPSPARRSPGGRGGGDSNPTSSPGPRRRSERIRANNDEGGGGTVGGGSPRAARFSSGTASASAATSSSSLAGPRLGVLASIDATSPGGSFPREQFGKRSRRGARRRKRERDDPHGFRADDLVTGDVSRKGDAAGRGTPLAGREKGGGNDGGGGGGNIILLDDDSDDGGGKIGPAGRGAIEVLDLLGDEDDSESGEVDVAGVAIASAARRCRRRYNNTGNAAAVAVVSNGAPTVISSSSSLSAAAPISGRKRQRDEVAASSPATAASATTGVEKEGDRQKADVENPRSDAKEGGDDTPIARVLDFFPDLDPAHAERMLRNGGVRDDVLCVPVPMPHGTDLRLEGQIQTVVALLLDGESYPKRSRVDGGGSGAGGGGGGASMVGGGGGAAALAVEVISRPEEARRPYLYDYVSPSPFQPSDKYKVQAPQRLAAAVPFLSMKGIELFLAKCDGRYSVVHTRVCDAVLGPGEQGAKKTTGTAAAAAAGSSSSTGDLTDEEVRRFGRRHKRLNLLLTGNSALTVDEIERLKVGRRVTTLCRPRRGRDVVPPVDPADADVTLADEARYATDALADRSAEVRSKADRLRARRASKRTGSVFECGCCFSDDLAFEEMVSCRDEGHLFCVDCCRRHAEERVFGLGSLEDGGGGSSGEAKKKSGGAAELRCMHGDCGSGFPRDLLMKALPAKVMKKYEELQTKAALGKAAVEDLCTCPKCDFQAVLPPTERIFHCPVEDCRFESCRECGEPPHIPLRCDEVEKKCETDGRRTVEEAMTEARVRTCPRHPRCKNRFYKTDGCNKMTCPPPCGVFVCYVCRAEIPITVGYAHFCQTPHCTHDKCKKCPLYSNAKEDDMRAAKEAGLKAAEEVLQKSLHGKDGASSSATAGGDGRKKGDDGGVSVDVDALLHDPDQAQRQAARGNAAAAAMPAPPAPRHHPPHAVARHPAPGMHMHAMHPPGMGMGMGPPMAHHHHPRMPYPPPPPPRHGRDQLAAMQREHERRALLLAQAQDAVAGARRRGGL